MPSVFEAMNANAKKVGGHPDPVGRILERIDELDALKQGRFVLSADGQTSDYYFDGRLLTLDPEGIHMVASAMLPMVRESGAEAVAGPTMGADPITTAVSLLSRLDEDRTLGALVVRTSAKDYGTGKAVEGRLTPGMKVAVVDDTCASGGTLVRTIETLRKADCEVTGVFCVLDRLEGGQELVQAQGVQLTSLVHADGNGGLTRGQAIP
jgi:orotate phosphoribosyltransferase